MEWNVLILIDKGDEKLSRSFKKNLAWGKAKASKMTRKGMCEPLRTDAGKVTYKNHFRAKYQTFEDYVDYVKKHFNIDSQFNDMYDRRHFDEYKKWLNGREETEELIKEYANMLFKKDRSC